jgi:hypothetical protein
VTIEIRLSYNGKPWVYHTVSVGFWDRLQALLTRKPHFDCIAEVSPYAK